MEESLKKAREERKSAELEVAALKDRLELEQRERMDLEKNHNIVGASWKDPARVAQLLEKAGDHLDAAYILTAKRRFEFKEDE